VLFSKKLSLLRAEKEISQQNVAEYLTSQGYSTTNKAVSRWEIGASEPDITRFLLLCKLYEIRDVQSCFLDERPENPYDALNSAGRSRAKEYIGYLASDAAYSTNVLEKNRGAARQIPLYDLPVSAGTGAFLDSDAFELIEVDEAVPLNATYAVRVSGDSMEPEFEDRQIIYIKPQQTLEHGEIGIFYLNGDAYFKEFQGDRLISYNSKYKPIKLNEYDEFRIYGRVLS